MPERLKASDVGTRTVAVEQLILDEEMLSWYSSRPSIAEARPRQILDQLVRFLDEGGGGQRLVTGVGFAKWICGFWPFSADGRRCALEHLPSTK